MTSRNYNLVKLKKRISICKERLDALKDDGFIFSKDIYNDLESLRNKIIQPSLSYRIWKKKYQISIGIMSIIFLFAIVYVYYYVNPTSPPITPTSSPMTITVNNIDDWMIINKDYTINGTAAHTNGQIRLIQVKIDGNPWENATGTVLWSYQLIVDNLSNGSHILSFQCTDGKTDPVIINKRIVIQKESVHIPTVAILYPSDGAEDLSGIISINGTASTVNGEIQEIKIRFNYDPWITIVNATTQWNYNWETTSIPNGFYYISVQSFDNISMSNIIQIGVTISNVNVDDDDPWIPSFETGEYFQLYFPTSKKVIIPNQTFEVKGYHRGRIVPYIFRSYFPVYTTIEIINKPVYMNVIPVNTLVTKPDNELHNFSIKISITDDAEMNKIIPLTVSYVNRIYDPQKHQSISLGRASYPYDIYIFTGQW